MFKAFTLSVFSLVLSFLSLVSFAQEPANQDVAGQRFMPTISSHAMVVSQDPIATKIGLDILKEGGNAVDAAVAMGFAMAVSLPRAGNLGGGGFMLIWLQKEHKMLALDYREVAPGSISPQDFITKDHQVDRHKVTGSYLSAGVPGTVMGLTEAAQKYGSLPLKTLMEPAIELAENGMVVNQDLALSLLHMQAYLARSHASSAVFLHPDGRPYRQGELLRQKDLAQTLKAIAQKGADGFYHGPVAQRLARAMARFGGKVTAKDLAHYQAKWRTPVMAPYKGYHIYSMPPPSSGGITLIEMLQILSHFPLAKWGHNSAQSLHVMSEAMNLAYLDRNQYLADPDFISIPQKRLLSPKHADVLASKINISKHMPPQKIAMDNSVDEAPQTTHYSVLDKDGNAVSNTYTLNHAYGNGYVVPGLGFLLNNELDDFTIIPGQANMYGLRQGSANLIAPGKRPLSSMTPSIVLKNKQVFLVMGSPGGSRIINAVLQVMLNVIDYHLNLASSVAAPRIHSQAWPDSIQFEQGISPDTLAKLQSMGHKLVQGPAIGAVECILKQKSQSQFPHLEGAFDPRRGGYALGY